MIENAMNSTPYLTPGMDQRLHLPVTTWC